MPDYNIRVRVPDAAITDRSALDKLLAEHLADADAFNNNTWHIFEGWVDDIADELDRVATTYRVESDVDSDELGFGIQRYSSQRRTYSVAAGQPVLTADDLHAAVSAANGDHDRLVAELQNRLPLPNPT